MVLTAIKPHRQQSVFRQESLDTLISGSNSIPSADVHQTPIKADLLQTLSKQIEDLRQEHTKHIQNVQRLEVQIEEGEIVCGRLMQQYLEIGRAIQLKKKHLAEDKEELSKEHQSRDSTDQAIDMVLKRISSLVLDIGNQK